MLTNAVGVHRELLRRCPGCSRHVQLIGDRRAAEAARYPKGLCLPICRGIRILPKSHVSRAAPVITFR